MKRYNKQSQEDFWKLGKYLEENAPEFEGMSADCIAERACVDLDRDVSDVHVSNVAKAIGMKLGRKSSSDKTPAGGRNEITTLAVAIAHICVDLGTGIPREVYNIAGKAADVDRFVNKCVDCGMEGLEWRRYKGHWRYFDAKGNLHDCPNYKKKGGGR